MAPDAQNHLQWPRTAIYMPQMAQIIVANSEDTCNILFLPHFRFLVLLEMGILFRCLSNYSKPEVA
jgi:hypothetical protein